MFKVGDVIVYGVHGLSRIDDICEKTIADETKKYYVLHPLDNSSLTISVPIDNKKILMQKIMNREEAKKILQTFKEPGIPWIEDAKLRSRQFKELVHSGNRDVIAKLVNTLMRKEEEYKLKNRKLYDQDQRMLNTIQNILFKELAMSLGITYSEITKRISNLMKN